jgi:hypothetical protein
MRCILLLSLCIFNAIKVLLCQRAPPGGYCDILGLFILIRALEVNRHLSAVSDQLDRYPFRSLINYH